ncbi:MAG: hypothetical protein LUC86_07940, partial [Prevotellaceae bacterium]|nr:hypothetical protein [Prevotellaceae bacterium]
WLVVVAVIVVGLIVGFSVRGCDKTDSHSWEAVDSNEVMAVDELPFDTAYIPHTVNGAKMTYNGVSYKYTGDVNEDGQPEGKGRGVYEDGTYEGEYVNGCRQGEATFVTTGGEDKFEGLFWGDEYHEGTLTLVDDGSFFKGTFSGNEPYTGTWYNKDGSVYCKLINGKMR